MLAEDENADLTYISRTPKGMQLCGVFVYIDPKSVGDHLSGS